MSRQYTKGPWEVIGATKCQVRAFTSQRPIANCETPGNTWPQDRANALLITKAPELLEAASVVLKGFAAGVFCRDISRDDESDWAVRALPYITALGRLEVATKQATATNAVDPVVQKSTS